MAGYGKEEELSPSVYFGDMTKRQLEVVGRILRGGGLAGRFPGMRVVSAPGVVAVVLDGRGTEPGRRATV